MGRHFSCVKQKLRKGLWSPEEDEKLLKFIARFGVGSWSSVPKHAGLQRCGKSCRLRWINYLRPDVKRGMFSQEEEVLILQLHQVLGNRWAQIAAQLPGRTDNEIKNFWNSCLKKKLMKQGIDPSTHKPITNNDDVKGKNDELCDRSGVYSRSSSSMRVAPDLEQAFYINNGGFMPSSSSPTETGSLHDTSLSKSVCDPTFLVEFQSGMDPIGYNSNLLAQYHQTNYDNSFPNVSCFHHRNPAADGATDFSDHHSVVKTNTNSFMMTEGRESSSTTNTSNMNTSLSAGFRQMTLQGEIFQINGVYVRSEEGQWKRHMQEIQLNNASNFISHPMGSLPAEYTGAFHQI